MIVTVGVVAVPTIHKLYHHMIPIVVGIIPLMIALIMSSITFQTKGHGMMMMNEILLKKI